MSETVPTRLASPASAVGCAPICPRKRGRRCLRGPLPLGTANQATRGQEGFVDRSERGAGSRVVALVRVH